MPGLCDNFFLQLQVGRSCIANGWQPWNLGAALRGWWDADDHGTALMTDDGAGAISAWRDRIARIVTTGATTARPTWASASYNSLFPAVTFDGSANCLTTATYTGLPEGGIGGEIWAAFSQALTPSITAVVRVLQYGGSTTSSNRQLGRTVVTGVNRAYVADPTVILPETLVDLSGIHIAQGTWAGTVESIAVDGMTATTASIASLNTTNVRLRLGANNAGSPGGFWSGPIRHVIVTTTLPTAQQQQMAGWLAWDANLPALLPTTNPYRYARP